MLWECEAGVGGEKKLLASVEAEAMRCGNNSWVRELKSIVNVLLEKEIWLWRQRSRDLWLKKGDNNSKFFHHATQRFMKNTILSIRYRDGQRQDQTDLVGDTIVDYYKELFTTCNPVLQADSLSYVPQLVTDEINSQLTGEFMEWNIHAALKQMVPLKVPGPDRMPLLFYQHFWGMMNHEVTMTILSWLNLGNFPHPINHTYITLIPKVKSLEFVSEYHSISLCNVLYKIFTKVLANNLKKKKLPKLITDHQFSFAKNYLISNNVLVAFETLHFMKNHNSGKTRFMAVKLDMSKAYNKVKWVFMENRVFMKNLMKRMGFCSS